MSEQQDEARAQAQAQEFVDYCNHHGIEYAFFEKDKVQALLNALAAERQRQEAAIPEAVERILNETRCIVPAGSTVPGLPGATYRDGSVIACDDWDTVCRYVERQETARAALVEAANKVIESVGGSWEPGEPFHYRYVGHSAVVALREALDATTAGNPSAPDGVRG